MALGGYAWALGQLQYNWVMHYYRQVHATSAACTVEWLGIPRMHNLEIDAYENSVTTRTVCKAGTENLDIWSERFKYVMFL